MLKSWLTIGFLFCGLFSFAQDGLIGVYRAKTGISVYNLRLFPDSTFDLLVGTCGGIYGSIGEWYLGGDSLYLDFCDNNIVHLLSAFPDTVALSIKNKCYLKSGPIGYFNELNYKKDKKAPLRGRQLVDAEKPKN